MGLLVDGSWQDRWYDTGKAGGWIGQIEIVELIEPFSDTRILTVSPGATL